MLGATDAENLVRLAGWAGVALAALVVFVIGAYWLRKRVHGNHSDENPSWGLDLERLRELHEAGDLTDGEYRVLRAKTLEGLMGRRSGEGPS